MGPNKIFGLKINFVSEKKIVAWNFFGLKQKFWSEGWDRFQLKGEIHSSIWSTKTFLYAIREPKYKQNNMGDQIRFKEFEIMNNLLSWNPILPEFIHNFSSYECFLRLGHNSFEKLDQQLRLKYKNFSVRYQGTEI